MQEQPLSNTALDFGSFLPNRKALRSQELAWVQYTSKLAGQMPSLTDSIWLNTQGESVQQVPERKKNLHFSLIHKVSFYIFLIRGFVVSHRIKG